MEEQYAPCSAIDTGTAVRTYSIDIGKRIDIRSSVLEYVPPPSSMVLEYHDPIDNYHTTAHHYYNSTIDIDTS